MEDTLRVKWRFSRGKRIGVLILVLMEDTLRETFTHHSSTRVRCLNPCFNGNYSQS